MFNSQAILLASTCILASAGSVRAALYMYNFTIHSESRAPGEEVADDKTYDSSVLTTSRRFYS